LSRTVNDFTALICWTLDAITRIVCTLTAEACSTRFTFFWIAFIRLARFVYTCLAFGADNAAAIDLDTLAIDTGLAEWA
jgi:hypothetical protein